MKINKTEEKKHLEFETKFKFSFEEEWWNVGCLSVIHESGLLQGKDGKRPPYKSACLSVIEAISRENMTSPHQVGSYTRLKFRIQTTPNI